MKITAYIEVNFWHFLMSFIIQFEIKCKMTADVWAISGYEKSKVPTFYYPVRTYTLYGQMWVASVTSCFIAEVVEHILNSDFSTQI